MTATLLLTAPAAAGVLRIPARAAVAFVKNKAAKAAYDMSRFIKMTDILQLCSWHLFSPS